MKIQFILHANFEQPGIITSWAEQKGFETAYCRPFNGDSIPNVDTFDWLIVMGGPQSPLHLDKYPYLQSEMELIQKGIAAQKCILGICLGAQLIGQALGAQTEKSPHKEVGVFPIELTEAGKSDPLFKALNSTLPVVHWHGDMPGLTEESQLLATSKGCPRQIVRYNEHTIGLQCHFEPTQEDIAGMIKHCPEDLTPGSYIQSKEEFLASDFDTINGVMTHLLDRLYHSYCKALA
ncbi:MAG: hypothetical protein S4CHLAM81_00820 [Chlamydiales bacterium]|nr:hypothetical protein [Chlamydiales bacterium]MCH9634878.1 hypothetical protein [Chlamydiales bacterium]MCH9703709.1 homoserine O-succinyltransferase [Chlamydiota bacterium]